jgi:hypothetical protein
MGSFFLSAVVGGVVSVRGGRGWESGIRLFCDWYIPDGYG